MKERQVYSVIATTLSISGHKSTKLPLEYFILFTHLLQGKFYLVEFCGIFTPMLCSRQQIIERAGDLPEHVLFLHRDASIKITVGYTHMCLHDFLNARLQKLFLLSGLLGLEGQV